MSGRVGHRKRLICVNAANLRANHLYLTGHADFFPADSYGAPTAKGTLGKLLRLDVPGLSAPVMTDIPTEAGTGKPRRFFRKRAWVREFFQKHGIKPGDTIAIERVSSHRFRVTRSKPRSNATVRQRLSSRKSRKATGRMQSFAWPHEGFDGYAPRK